MVWKALAGILVTVARRAEKMAPRRVKYAWWKWNLNRLENKVRGWENLAEDKRSTATGIRVNLLKLYTLGPDDIKALEADPQSEKSREILRRYKYPQAAAIASMAHTVRERMQECKLALGVAEDAKKRKDAYLEKIAEEI